MWGTSSHYESINSYADAERVYNSIKPLRGHPDFRPLERRSIDCKSRIIKQGDEYIIRLYRTDIVRYFKDGSVFVSTGNWSTQSTAAAISAMSPFSCWCSKGSVVVRAHDLKRFVLPSGGLLFVGGQPVNPPVAVQHKTRIKKAEARQARKFFAEVPKMITAFSAAFEGGTKPEFAAAITGRMEVEELSGEQAASIAWYYVQAPWGYVTRKQTITNNPDKGIKEFWTAVYKAYDLIESYETELPFGEVP